MSERRVIVSLTREQAEALIRSGHWMSATQIAFMGPLGEAVAELSSALAVYDATQHPRLAAVQNLDAGSLIEHDASHSDPYHYPERQE